MNKFKAVIFVAAVGILASGCPKRAPVPEAEIGRLEAERAIVIAQAEINEASELGADVSEPEGLLEQARENFERERYRRAYDEAIRAGDMARRMKDELLAEVRSREDSAAAIERAENLIGEARDLGGDVSEPSEYLERAKELHQAEDFTAAVGEADTAANLATALIASLRAERYTVGTWEADRDCLWNIAGRRRIYNDPWKWKRIYQANRDKITDPDLIFPGQELVIPRD